MQKWLLILLLFFLVSCTRDIRYTASDAVVDTTSAGQFHARVYINLQEKKFATPLGVQVHSFGAFDVYWDGIKVGRNGIPAVAGSAEVPGTETSYYQIPDALSGLGNHLVEVKGSQMHLRETGRIVMAKPESYLKLLRQPLIELSLVNLMAGAFLIAAIYYAFLYINSQARPKTMLLFALICFLFFSLLAMEYIKFYIDIPYTRFYTRLKIVGWLTFAIALLIPLYFAIHYRLPGTGIFIGSFTVVLLAIYIINYEHYDLTAHLHSLALWIASVLVLLYALLKKQKGSTLVLMGFVLSMVVNQFMFYDFGLYIAFTIILLCILYLQTTTSRQLEEAHQASLLLSSRLQLELVKKNIQPHFLRNTLTSLIDWVEESPADGVKFIKALSGEFDLMMEMAEETLVSVRREIDLCRHHLEVMQYRKEIIYIWDEQGIDDHEMIPPAIILTLVENGVTHSIPVNNRIRFVFNFKRSGHIKEYVLETYGDNRVTEKASGGNGFRYIKARLTESYGDNWQFSAEPFSGGWRSSIQISI
ncbi:histidine kinase [Mucilaginibacter lappiensis]|uniref:histidine kinase n=1 Tax=Mucilaginibacter lappiensis TaxID=354630 RepID=UPI003D1A9AD2